MSPKLPVQPAERGIVRTAIYARVSTGEQADKICDSCESQIAVCRDFSSRMEGWAVRHTFRDERTGRDGNRPDFKKLKRLIEDREIDIVLAYRSDRLYRNSEEAMAFERFANAHGVRVVLVMEPYATDTAAEKLSRRMFWSLAEFGSDLISENVRRSIHSLAKAGRTHGGIPCYGYDTYRNQLLIVEKDAAIVREAFEMAARGMTPFAIATEFNNRGERTRRLVPKSGKAREMGGRRFRVEDILRFLRSPIPKGIVRHRATGEEFPGCFEAIVSAKQWEEANVALDRQPRSQEGRIQERDKYFYPLKGLMRCNHCRSALTPTQSGKRREDGQLYHYYICSAHRRAGDDSRCRIKSVPARAIERMVVEFIGEMANQPEVIQRILIQQGRGKGALVKRLKKERTGVERELRDLDREIKRLAEAVLSMAGNAVGEELRKQADEASVKKQVLMLRSIELRNEIEAHESQELTEEKVKAGFARFSEAIGTLPSDEQRELHQLLVSRIVVKAGGEAPDPIHEKSRRKRAARKRLTLEIKFRAAALTALELGGAADEKSIAERRRTIAFQVEVAYCAKVPEESFAILSPVYREFGSTPDPRKRPLKVRHEIHRALEWKREIEELGISQNEFARRKGISSAAMAQGMRCLRLSTTAREFLMGLSSAKNIRILNRERISIVLKLPEIEHLAALQGCLGTFNDE